MAQKLVAIDAGSGNQFPLLYVDPYGVALQITDPAGDWEHDCCCGCDSFLHCLACLDEHTYTSSQTVNWPADVKSCDIICWGHGGKGGNSTAAGEAAGGGGGGGVAVAWEVTKNSGSSSLTLIINDASNAYATEVKQDGDTVCMAYAGEDGGDGPDGTGGPGGWGGSGVFVKSGGSGADGDDNSHAGGGGGGAGDLVSGSDANGAEGGKGGYRKGGDGGSASGSAAGKNYGGGGAGGYGGAQGGAGGNGLVRIYWRRPMTMNLTIGGAQSDQRQDCCSEDSRYYNKHLLWSNLNRPFVLTQSSPGNTEFCWKAIEGNNYDLDSLDRDAVLIETFDDGTYFQCDGPDEQLKIYVVEICATVTCDSTDGRMKLAGVTLNCASCSRNYLRESDKWSDWLCFGGTGCGIDLPCGDTGPDLQTANPCTRQTMIKRIYWPTINDEECALDGTCSTTSDGTLTARLTC